MPRVLLLLQGSATRDLPPAEARAIIDPCAGGSRDLAARGERRGMTSLVRSLLVALVVALAVARAQDAPLLHRLPGDAGALELVPVVAGTYALGEPARPTRVAAFAVARTEVTWRQYRAFCAATGREAPALPEGATDAHPAADVTWDEAAAFCAWAGLALPTEFEWEAAARGQDGRAFPWGDAPVDRAGNFCDRSCPEPFEWKEPDVDDGHGRTAPVGSFPAGASPCGALDMGGNVWEWCDDATDDGAFVARGGGWCSPRMTGATTSRNAFPRDTRWAGLGFRPVRRQS